MSNWQRKLVTIAVMLVTCIALQPNLVLGQMTSNETLYANGYAAYANNDWFNAAINLYAYMQRDPAEMLNDPGFSESIRQVISTCQAGIAVERDYYFQAAGDCNRSLTNCQARLSGDDTSAGTSGLGSPPLPPKPPLRKPRQMSGPDGYYDRQSGCKGSGICLEFSDKYLWQVEDESIVEGRKQVGNWNGRVIEGCGGFRGRYLHILGTDLVRFEPKNK